MWWLMVWRCLVLQVSELSGGWRMRAALAHCLVHLEDVDVLLLDEPTNHCKNQYLHLHNISHAQIHLCLLKGFRILLPHDVYIALLCELVFLSPCHCSEYLFGRWDSCYKSNLSSIVSVNLTYLLALTVDLPTIAWLQNFLTTHARQLTTIVLFVSHDRAFLSSVATDIVEMKDTQLHYFSRYDYIRFIIPIQQTISVVQRCCMFLRIVIASWVG